MVKNKQDEDDDERRNHPGTFRKGKVSCYSWFVSELPEKDISNVVVQCR